jgi:glutamate formiminotransferase
MHFKNFLFLSLAFVGHPQAVIEAALAAGRAAYNLIDMTRHNGEHPRIGAMVIEKFFENFF